MASTGVASATGLPRPRDRPRSSRRTTISSRSTGTGAAGRLLGGFRFGRLAVEGSYTGGRCGHQRAVRCSTPIRWPRRASTTYRSGAASRCSAGSASSEPGSASSPASETVRRRGQRLPGRRRLRVPARPAGRPTASIFVDYTYNTATVENDLVRATTARHGMWMLGASSRSGSERSREATIAARQWSQRALTPAGLLSKFLRPLENPVTDERAVERTTTAWLRLPPMARTLSTVSGRCRCGTSAARRSRSDARQGLHPRRQGAAGPVGHRPLARARRHGRGRRRLGRRQVDAPADPRHPRPADLRLDPVRRRGADHDERERGSPSSATGGSASCSSSTTCCPSSPRSRT